ncbi:hypothetical protein [Patulibacter americanus]|uniref:hypothetical protein n=1 Tax=Patulibacter americanus TaxID=588672 RepID=UPI0003B5300A|nr:hypothetical protein [Patulibacter americanus]
MRRLVPLSLVLLLATGGATAQAADTGAPRLARGGATLTAAHPGTTVASFLSGRPLDVTVLYRRRTAARTVRLAARFGPRGGRCPRRPSAADRRRLRATGGVGSTFTASGRARFAAGKNVVCVWPQEGSGGYRRPIRLRESFRPSLFAATAVEGTNGPAAGSGAVVQSSSPVSGTYTRVTLGTGDGCGERTGPASAMKSAGLHTVNVAGYTGSACTGFRLEVSGRAGSATVAVGQTAVGTPTRVVQHVGACNPSVLGLLPVTRQEAARFLAGAGCRLGRLIRGRKEGTQDPVPSRALFRATYRGLDVAAAPRGATVDAFVDDLR